MNPMLRLRLMVSMIGFVVWAVGALAERNGAPWARTMMTAGLVILAIAVVMRFIKPRGGANPPSEPPNTV